MQKIKTLFLSVILVMTTFSITGCGGEADYSFEDVLSAFAKNLVTGSIEFDIPNKYISESSTTDVTVIPKELSSDRFSIVGGTDGALFIIDASTGKLSFSKKPDVGNYQVMVGVTRDDKLSTFTLTVEVVADITKAKPIVDYAVKSLDVVISDEVLTQIEARPADPSSELTFSLDDNKSMFQIDNKGNLTLIDGAQDYTKLTATLFDLYVTITDGHSNSVNVGPIALTLVENADLIRPIIKTREITVSENLLSIPNIKITTTGTGVIDSYILSGADKEYFTLSSTGDFAFKEANDFETLPNTFNITVQVGDDNGNLSEVQAIVISVSDLIETFTFQGIGNFTPIEGDTIVGTIIAIPIVLKTVPAQYSLVKGGNFLVIDKDGVIRFKDKAIKGQSIEVEVLAQSELNGSDTWSGVFNVIVKDDLTKILPAFDTYKRTITVNDPVDEALSFLTVSATPKGDSTEISVYEVGGTDATMFMVDLGGRLYFTGESGDYVRKDVGGNNIFYITVTAIDNNNNSRTSDKITITLNVNEKITFPSIDNMDVGNGDTKIIKLNASSAKGYALEYSLKSNSSSKDVSISFNQETGEMIVKGLDRHFFSTNTHSITVKINDIYKYGAPVEQSFKVTVKR